MKKKIVLGLLSLALVIGASDGAYALDSYLATFNTTYGTAGTSLNTCALCHLNPAGGGALNPYGNAYATTHNFAAIEGLDSDSDGFTNIAEINARTFPGNSLSYPLVSSTVPVPAGQQVFPAFVAPNLPAPSVTPSVSQPIGVGTIAVGGDNLELRVNTGTFAGAVDVYFGISAPLISPDIFLLTPAGGLQPTSAGLAKWKAGVLSVTEDLFGAVPVSTLPPGTYNLYLAVTPANGLSAFYIWQTSFTIGVNITTTLSGSQEVPPVATAAIGIANFAVNFTTGTMIGTLTFSGLSGPATAAHFHQAAAGSNGSVVIPLTVPATTSGAITISTTLTPALLTALMSNQLYFNIHTGANPGGEIRGQILYSDVVITTAVSGTQEVPPVTTAGNGIANLTFDVVSGALSGSITFSGLSGPATAAHFHQAAAGTNGLVVIPLVAPAAASGTINVSTTLTAAQRTALGASQLYINIHTLANAGGEIRGQVFYPVGAPLP